MAKYASHMALAFGLGCAGALAAAPAEAQVMAQSTAPSAETQSAETISASDLPAEDIIVTANKRESRLQDTPIAITAISGDALTRRGVSNIADVAATTPNLHIGESGSNSGMIISIRGVSSNITTADGDPATAFHVDGVYVPRPTAAGAVMYDVDRVEILRGPQGTLWGRNATAGAIDIVSRRPTLSPGVSGFFNGVAGYRDHFGAEGALDLTAIDDVLGFRASFRLDNHDGYMRNESPVQGDTFDAREYAARLGMLYRPGDRLSVYLSGDYFKRGGRGTGTASLRLDRDDPFRINTNTPTDADLQTGGVRGEVRYDGGAIDIVSLSGYRHDDTYSLSDTDAGPVSRSSLNFIAKGDVFSQELRLSNKGTQRFRWMIGGYYFQEDVSDKRNIFTDVTNPASPNILRNYDYRRKTRSFAALANLEYDLTDTLTLVAGGRITRDRKAQAGVLTTTNYLRDGNGPTVVLAPSVDNDRASWSKFTWKAGANWKITPRNLLYASVSTGFKAGGFNSGLRTVAPGLIPYNPEKITAYEVGSKNSFAGGLGTLNITAFHYRYANLQQTQLFQGFQYTANAAQATISGVEMEGLLRPVEGLTITANLAFLRSRYDSFSSYDFLAANQLVDVSGNRLPKAPKWNGGVRAEYGHDVGNARLTISSDLHFESLTYMDEFNGVGGPGREYTVQPSFAKVDVAARLSSLDDRRFVQIFVKNVGDKAILRRGFVIASGDIVGNYDEPRTWGVQFGTKF